MCLFNKLITSCLLHVPAEVALVLLQVRVDAGCAEAPFGGTRCAELGGGWST